AGLPPGPKSVSNLALALAGGWDCPIMPRISRMGHGMGFIERIRADATWLRGALRALRMTTPIAKNPTRVFPFVVEELAEKFGDAPALLSPRERMSYRELSERANRYARWPLGDGR